MASELAYTSSINILWFIHLILGLFTSSILHSASWCLRYVLVVYWFGHIRGWTYTTEKEKTGIVAG